MAGRDSSIMFSVPDPVAQLSYSLAMLRQAALGCDQPSDDSSIMASTEETTTKYKKPHIYPTLREPVLLRKMFQDDVYLLGGLAAIMLQWLHPAIAKGSLTSQFATRKANRLHNTIRFISTALRGTQEEKEAIFSVIHRYHARVKGPGYDANDPELHKWTAATLFAATVWIHEAFFGKMDRDLEEQICMESAVFATSLRMPPEMWPKSLDKFWEYFNHGVQNLPITPEALKLWAIMKQSDNLPLDLRAAMPIVHIITSNILPRRVAKLYGAKPSAVSRASFKAMTYSVSMLYPWIPAKYRQNRTRFYHSDRAEVAARIRKTGHWIGVAPA